jgi:signal transduction histidine kinase
MDLRPGVLDCGIVAAVQWQAKEFHDRTAIPCQVSCSHDEIPLAPERSVAVFRVFQETLTNISKHAGASKVGVRLAQAEGRVELEVTDDGHGITGSDTSKPGSFGIRGMRERCRDLGGDMQIAGTPGKGTRISISVPVQHEKKKRNARQAAAKIASMGRRPGNGVNLKNAVNTAATPHTAAAPQYEEDSNDPGSDYR